MSILISQSLGYQKALTIRTRFTAPNNVRIGYIVVGRPVAWDANDAIPTSIDTADNQFHVSNFLLGGKRITGNDVSIVIPRRTWTTGTIYTSFDDRSNTLFTSANGMYVHTAAGSVYKCLDNSNGLPSTIEPIGDYVVNNGVIASGDGYVWKYMYKIEGSNKFLTTEWLPVPTEQNESYFGHANNVVQGAISGVVVVSGGSGYDSNTNVSITGVGVSATATANVSNGAVTAIVVTNPGIHYTRQNSAIEVTGAGSGANVRLVLPLRYGHAFNPALELGANTVMFSVKIGEGDATEGGKITSNNDFRQIGLLMDPHKYGEDVPVTIATANLTVSMVTQIVLTSGPSYQLDEQVYQGTDLANSTFSAYVSDVFTNAIDVVGLSGEIRAGFGLIGANTGIARTVVSTTNPDLEVGSGDLVYIENMSPVMRSPGQAESIKLVLRY